jgi:hypothetical protein
MRSYLWHKDVRLTEFAAHVHDVSTRLKHAITQAVRTPLGLSSICKAAASSPICSAGRRASASSIASIKTARLVLDESSLLEPTR